MSKTENLALARAIPARRGFLLSAIAASVGVAILRPSHAADSPPPVGGDVTIVPYKPNGLPLPPVKVAKVVKTETAWKAQLPEPSFDVLRHEGTERAFTGPYWNLHDKGLYRCLGCDTPLFTSETKYESGTGWPSFWQPLAKENVNEITDHMFGMLRTAISCKRCDGHLGHVFDDGPPPTGLRYCMNSVAMRFVKFA